MESSHNKIIEDLSQLLLEFNQRSEESTDEEGLFIIKKANDALTDASLISNPRSLWKTLWFEGEISCLFSDSNLGKSIYAVQIASEIAKTDKVLYFDFELSEKQFQLRYTNDKTNERFVFPSNLYRVEINCEKLNPFTFEEIVIDEILKLALKRDAKIIIIDNLTYLCSAMEKAEAAGTLMQQLISMKKMYGLSFLILAHTPKRPLWAVITQNDLQGSKRLYNLFDSVFAIGQSAKDEELRYIKELKVRWGRKTYGEHNVIVAKIVKPNNFLHFEEIGMSNEAEHIRIAADEQKDAVAATIENLVKEGKSYRTISSQLNIPKSTVAAIYNKSKKKK